MTYRRRTYPEVLDNLLTSLTGGVASESHPFPPPGGGDPPRHDLERPPAAEVVSVYGSRGGEPFLFRQGEDGDFALADEGRAVEWRPGARLPDPGTLVEINYRPEDARPAVTDIRTGSVVRTLSESIALEVARLYAQLETVYDAAYLDSATGTSLDNVVALLGLTRLAAGHAVGEAEFRRARGAAGAVFLPAGTRLMTADGSVEYETTAAVRLADGQTSVRAPIRDLELNEPLPADALTALPVPVAGVAAVTNPAPTRLGNAAESDEELRVRARNFLHGSERATLGALRAAVARQGVAAEIVEVAGAGGLVEVVPLTADLEPAALRRLERAIEDTRPAGVEVRLGVARPPRPVSLRLQLTTVDGLLEADRIAAHLAVREAVERLLRERDTAAPLSLNRLAGAVLAVEAVADLRLLEATWRVAGADEALDTTAGELPIGGSPVTLGDLELIDPGLPARLETVLTFPPEAPAVDSGAIEVALGEAVAALNVLNETPIAAEADAGLERQRRTLTTGRLLALLPLPGRTPATFAELDAALVAGAPLPLPAPADVAPFEVTFVVAQPSGLTRQLTATGDAYELAPAERLTVGAVELAALEPVDA